MMNYPKKTRINDRFCELAICSLAAVSAAATSPPLHAATRVSVTANLIADPGFESGLAGFASETSSDTISRSTVTPIAGAASLLVKSSRYNSMVAWGKRVSEIASQNHAQSMSVRATVRANSVASSTGFQICAFVVYDSTTAQTCVPAQIAKGKTARLTATVALDPAKRIIHVYERVGHTHGGPAQYSLDSVSLTLTLPGTVTPSPTPSPTPTVTPSPTPTVTPSPTPTPTVSPTPSPTPTVTPSPSPTVTPSPTPTPTAGTGRTLYVAKNGSDGSNNSCLNAASPCLTITRGISLMLSGDTLIVGDGTYAEPIKNMPSGTASAYTTIRAANDFGVLIDGSGFVNYYNDGIKVSSKHHVAIRGFRVKMNQANDTNGAIMVPYSDHVKIQRCSASYGGVTGNSASFSVGPASDYVLIEESFAYGGSRYQFLIYQSDHVVVRRNVARNDYWNGSLQCAGFTNYNSENTLWENNIVLDSDTVHCSGNLYGGFFNENKVPDSSYSGTSTRETFRGNIVLNVNAFYSGMYDYDVSSVHTYTDNIIWASHGGLYGDYIHGDAPVLNATRMTIGGITGNYGHPANGQGSAGVGFAMVGPGVTNSLTSSILWNNNSYGMTDFGTGDYNSYWGNGLAARGGQLKLPAGGAHDLSSDLTAGLKYLPRIETGSSLATAGPGGTQVGADVRYKWGATGTMWGEPGYDSVTTECLWPFPNEAIIKSSMASYNGPGGAGVRGFTAGNSRDGSPQSLTKYVWEYLGNPIPAGSLCP